VVAVTLKKWGGGGNKCSVVLLGERKGVRRL